MGMVKIISTGVDGSFANVRTGKRTRVFDVETGKEIKNIKSIDIRIAVNDVVSAKIEVFPSDLEVEALAEFKIVDNTSLKNEYRQYKRVAIKMNWFKKILWWLFFKGKDNGNN